MSRPRHSPLRHPVWVAAAPLRRRRPQHPRPAACRRTPTRTQTPPCVARRRLRRAPPDEVRGPQCRRRAGAAGRVAAEGRPAGRQRVCGRALWATAEGREHRRPESADALSAMRARPGLPRPRQRALGSCASLWRPPRPRGRVVVACGEATMAGRPRLTRPHWLTSPRRVTEADRPGASGWRCPEERARRAHSWSGLALPAWRRVGSPVSPARPSTFSSPSLIVSSGLDSSADGS